MSCAGLIVIMLMMTLIAVVVGGFYVVIHYVNRDEDLRQYGGTPEISEDVASAHPDK